MNKYYRERVDENCINESFVSEARLNKTQHDVILLIYKMTAMNVNQIANALGYKVGYIRNTLKYLYDKRFLDRKFLTVPFGTGSGKAVYFLDISGKIYVSGALNIKYRDIKWRKSENNIYNIKLEHTLGISESMANTSKAIMNTNNIKLEEWKSEKELGLIKFEFSGVEYFFAPDSFISISRVENSTKYIYDYFLEYDRKMSVKEFKNKLSIYELYKKSKKYTSRFEIYPSILIITESYKKALKIYEQVKNKNSENITYYITDIENFKKDPLKSLPKNGIRTEYINVLKDL
ncbi:MAG: replication-relaxation family protein [Clostridiales bacterium]